MRIAQIAPIVESVPPKTYGGTERVMSALTEELVARGHDVTLFATANSTTSAKLVSVVPRGLREEKNGSDMYGFNTPSLLHMGLAYARHSEFDIIHDHNPHVSLPTANVISTPVVCTWHGPYEATMVEYFARLSRPHLISISHSQAALAPQLRFRGTVYNGLSMEAYPFQGKPQEYLIFIGRIDMQKGVHLAMDAAVQLRKKLIIAAKLDETVPQIKEYFERYIEPRLRAHPRLLEWIGEVEEEERNELLKNALALLHAVTWPEPFGLTLIEAGACGTPVVAFNRGAIPEIVEDGVTGFVVESVEEMVEAVRNIQAIDRATCRARVLSRFSAKRMTDNYEAIYRKIIQESYGARYKPPFRSSYQNHEHTYRKLANE
jgi:glycosyltransferase involved in cell wall biosynthesis